MYSLRALGTAQALIQRLAPMPYQTCILESLLYFDSGCFHFFAFAKLLGGFSQECLFNKQRENSDYAMKCT